LPPPRPPASSSSVGGGLEGSVLTVVSDVVTVGRVTVGKVGIVIVGKVMVMSMVVDDVLTVVVVVVDEDEDELEVDVELDDVLVSSIPEVVDPGRTVDGDSLMLTSEASGRSNNVVDGRIVVCAAIVEDGNTSVGTSADCGRSRAAAKTAKTTSTPIGTSLFTN